MKPPESKSSKLGSKPSKPSGASGSRAGSGRGRSSRSLSAFDPDTLDFDNLGAEFDLSTTPVDSTDAKPNPVELPSPINPEGARKQSVESLRNLFCQYYDNCLDEAVKQGWNSFTCVRCGLYQVGPKPEEGVDLFATQRRG
jgi:hypothetical protein